MATTQGAPAARATSLPSRPDPVAVTPPDGQKTAVRLWVLFGCGWLALIVYVWGRWVTSSQFRVNTIGRSQAPTWYDVVVWVVQIIFGIVITAWIVWHFIVAPKLRTGRFSFDGLFFIACGLMFFQEPWMNWMNLQFLYSTVFVNFGSWLNFTPGWSSPNARLIPVPIVYGCAYLWMVGLGTFAASRYMTRQSRRHPGRSNERLVLQTFGVLVVADFVVESIMTRLQLINYPRTIPSLTLFAGTNHQFPIYEMLAWPGTFIMCACLHYFRDDQGRSWPERGIDKLSFKSERLKTFCRFAAIVGFCQLAILIWFNLPYQVYGLHAGTVPKSQLDQPWRMAGVCGPGTAYNCGGPGINIPRSDSRTNRVPPIRGGVK